MGDLIIKGADTGVSDKSERIFNKPSLRFGPLDEIRGAAALAVFVVHFVQVFYKTDDMGWLGIIIKQFGVWGVSIFFILSGFLIHSMSLKEFEANKKISWRNYSIRRFFRIYPPYLFCLAISVLAGMYKQSNMITKASFENVLTHVFMISTYFPNHFETINAIFWTVIVEVHFYILYPVVWWLLKKISIWYIFGLSFIIGLIYFIGTSMLTHPGLIRIMHQHSSIALFWQWMLGVVLAEIYWRGKPKSIIKLLSFPFIIGLCLVFSFLPEIFLGNGLGLQYTRFVLPFISLVLFGVLIFSPVKNFKNQQFKCLGKVSYSLYLWHPLALLLIMMFFKNGGFMSFSIALLLSLLFAWISYVATENSSINIGKAIIKKLKE